MKKTAFIEMKENLASCTKTKPTNMGATKGKKEKEKKIN